MDFVLLQPLTSGLQTGLVTDPGFQTYLCSVVKVRDQR